MKRCEWGKMAASFSSVFLSPRCFFRRIRSVRCGVSAGVCLRSDHNSAGGRGEVLESTEEYKFVERLIPPTRVPTPPKHEGPSPSGWTPASETPPTLPYMIRRSRMHNVPVYSDIKRGNQKSTIVRKVEGDIWALDKEVKQYLEELTGREPPTQVNEVTGSIRVKGEFDTELKEWLVKKGF